MPCLTIFLGESNHEKSAEIFYKLILNSKLLANPEIPKYKSVWLTISSKKGPGHPGHRVKIGSVLVQFKKIRDIEY